MSVNLDKRKLESDIQTAISTLIADFEKQNPGWYFNDIDIDLMDISTVTELGKFVVQKISVRICTEQSGLLLKSVHTY